MATGAPYLVPGLYFGLVNQQITLLNSVAAAIILNYTLVIPPYSLDWRKNHHAADLAPLFDLHDEQHFARMAEKYRLSYVKELPPEYFTRCIQQLQSRHSYETMPLADLKTKAARHSVACLRSHHSIFLEKTFAAADAATASEYAALREAAFAHFLRPAAPWAAAVDVLVARLLARHNATRFASIHLRVEADWREACHSPSWIADQQHRGEACFITEDMYHDYLRDKRNVSAGVVVFVAGGEQPSASSRLCTRYQCVHHSDLQSAFDGPPLAKYHSLTGEGYLDLLVLERAAEFYGNPFSTFSHFAMKAVLARGGVAENVKLPPPATLKQAQRRRQRRRRVLGPEGDGGGGGSRCEGMTVGEELIWRGVGGGRAADVLR